MTKENESVSVAGLLLDALATVKGTTIEGLLKELNELLPPDEEISRAAFWKWRAGKGGPCLELSLLMEDAFGISPRAWHRVKLARQTQAEAS